MFVRFVAAMAAMLKYVGQATHSFLDWAEQVIRWPFDVLLGGGAPAPNFSPELTKTDVVEELKAARQAAAPSPERDVIEAVLEYCRAHPLDRVTMKLPTTLQPSVRAALLVMDDVALRRLSTSGIGQLRRFVAGETLGDEHVPVAANDAIPKGMTRHEHMAWRIRSRMFDGQQSEPFTLVKP